VTPTDFVEDHLFLWIVLSVGVGVAAPEVAVVTEVSTLVLAVMIGSMSRRSRWTSFGGSTDGRSDACSPVT
jgi:BASS family bile acid:Na+ symporter